MLGALLATVLAAIPLVGALVARRQGRKVGAYLGGCATIAVACLLCEGVIANWDALSYPSSPPRDASFEVHGIEDESDMHPSGSRSVTWVAEADVDVDGAETTTVELTFSGASRLDHAGAYLRDDARTETPFLTDMRTFSPGSERYGTVLLRASSKGEARSLSVRWDDPGATLESVRINVPVPYAFRMTRLFLAMLPLLLAWTVMRLALGAVAFAPGDRRQRVAYACVVLLATVLPVATYVLTTRPVHALGSGTTTVVNDEGEIAARDPLPSYVRSMEYPPDKDDRYIRYFAHDLLYESLLHDGVVQIDPSEGLLALDNPYDVSQRETLLSEEDHAKVLWDYSLYDGKYYIYFGVAPVLAIYAPYLALFGRLPSYAVAALMVAEGTVLVGALCVWEAMRRFSRSPSFVAVALCGVCVPMASGLLLMQSSTDMYYLCSAFSLLSFFLALLGALVGVRKAEEGRLGIPWFVLSGVGTTMSVCSRPSGVLSAVAWLLPLFVGLLARRGIGRRPKAVAAVSYAVPVALGAAFVLWFNNLRFGNPLDFGHYYQLTVEDLSWRHGSPHDVMPALWCYLLEGVRIIPEFPWVRFSSEWVNHSGNYLYHEGVGVGALMVPMTWGVLALRRTRRPHDDAVLWVALASVPVVCAIDYMAAGVNPRYVCDILPTLCLVGATQLANGTGVSGASGTVGAAGPEGDGEGASPVRLRILAVICALSLVLSACFVFDNERGYMRWCQVDNYMYFVRMFEL